MDLFGKKKEEQIRELQARAILLEKEKADLQETLQKRDERIRKLSRDFQEAQIRCKEAESRVAARAEIHSSGQEDESVRFPAAGQALGGRRLGLREITLLAERLQGVCSPREDLISAFLTSEGLKDLSALPTPATRLLAAARPVWGAMLFSCPHLFSLVLIPPFPVLQDQMRRGPAFDLRPLREMLDTPVLMLSLHAGESVVGVSLGGSEFEALAEVKSQVMGKHSKGGWSQRRFERLREEDVKKHASVVLQALGPILQKYRPLLRLAVVSGHPSLTGVVEGELGMPILHRRMEQHDLRDRAGMLDELYGFVSYLG